LVSTTTTAVPAVILSHPRFLIDDLCRMSRNTIESLRLGELADETGVRVVGASDGFDSANPQSSLLLPVFGSMNEVFITQLRSKVNRRMDDAFRRGDNIQPPRSRHRSGGTSRTCGSCRMSWQSP
jgi:DNA invertase Pin-like site-specific DNA recombinase